MWRVGGREALVWISHAGLRVNLFQALATQPPPNILHLWQASGLAVDAKDIKRPSEPARHGRNVSAIPYVVRLSMACQQGGQR